MPTAEALFWQHVRAGRLHGLKFRRQVPIPPYVADFLCASARLIVELDGPPHEAEARRRRDAARDAWLTEQGFQVLRFPNDVVLGNLGLVLDAVSSAVAARNAPSAPPPPSAGEGTPRSGGGEGSDDAERSADHATAANSGSVKEGALSGTGAPLSRPLLTQGPPSPAEGGGRGP